MIEKVDLSGIGKLEDYKNLQRSAIPHGLVSSPELILKTYLMIKGTSINNYSKKAEEIEYIKKHIKGEISSERLVPLSGLGFVIISDDMLNVARWDNGCPIVLRNQVYPFKRGFRNLQQLSLEEAGAFCAWELAIVSHEAKAWIKFLNSEKTNRDKQNYLENFISGRL